MTAIDLAANDGKKLLRRWLFGFFGVMFVANFVFLWFAFTTHTGVASQNAYEEGRLYNDVIAADARLDALGWQMGAEASGGSLLIRFLDGDGMPLDGQIVTAQLFRPSNAREDRGLMLTQFGEGQFAADITDLAGGHWQIRIILSTSEDQLELRRDIEIG